MNLFRLSRTRQTKDGILNLEQQKKQARELLRALRAGNHDALVRLRTQHLRWANVDDADVRQDLALHDAQFVIAREQGFASWTKLKAYADPSPYDRHTRLYVADLQWINNRAHGLMRTRQSAGPAALEQIRMTRTIQYPFEPFSHRVWELRTNLTVYDAWYVAVAEWLETDLVTADKRLANAAGPRCPIRRPGVS